MKIKAMIFNVGTVLPHATIPGVFIVDNWGMDTRNGAIQGMDYDDDGKILFGGWPISELKDISLHPSEWGFTYANGTFKAEPEAAQGEYRDSYHDIHEDDDDDWWRKA